MVVAGHGSGPLPAAFYPIFQVVDYTVHSWDIREGTGRPHALEARILGLGRIRDRRYVAVDHERGLVVAFVFFVIFLGWAAFAMVRRVRRRPG